MAFGFPAQYSQRIEITASRHTARESIEYSLSRLGWPFKMSDLDNYQVELGMSGLSWGEKIAISLSSSGVLQIESKCVGIQLFDWGKNKRNVTQFLGYFAARLNRNLMTVKEALHAFESNNISRVDLMLNENRGFELEERGKESDRTPISSQKQTLD